MPDDSMLRAPDTSSTADRAAAIERARTHATEEGANVIADATEEIATPDGDETLMLRFAAGDARAFEQLYERHERPTFRFLLRSVSDPALAEDLLQEVWITVIRSAPRYEARAQFKTWLYVIARGRLIDFWRARDPAILLSLDAPIDVDQDSTLSDILPADAGHQPEALAMNEAQARAFASAIEHLPAEQREAFLLHVQAGLTLTQVAAVTGIGVETIKSRLRYASAKLRKVMLPWRDDAGVSA